jgi:hypothetical protein
VWVLGVQRVWRGGHLLVLGYGFCNHWFGNALVEWWLHRRCTRPCCCLLAICESWVPWPFMHWRWAGVGGLSLCMVVACGMGCGGGGTGSAMLRCCLCTESMCAPRSWRSTFVALGHLCARCNHLCLQLRVAGSLHVLMLQLLCAHLAAVAATCADTQPPHVGGGTHTAFGSTSAGLSALVWQRACCLLLRRVRPVSGRQQCCKAGVAVCWQLCNLGCQQRVVDTLQLLSAHMVTISIVCVLADVQPGVSLRRSVAPGGQPWNMCDSPAGIAGKQGQDCM